MVRIRVTPGVVEDLARIARHLRHHEVRNAGARSEGIIGALDVLAYNPLIGRPVRQEQCELMIGRDAHGCVALYLYIAAVDTVFVLAVRAQRESGYVRDE